MPKNQSSSKHWIIMASGTGGHVMPALTIAKLLKTKGYSVSFLGSHGGMEQNLVPQQGFDLDLIPMQGVRRNGLLRWLSLPFLLLNSFYRSWRIFRTRRPMGVLGMGGFVSVPGGVVAWLMGIPLVIHEQNSVPGLANRALKPLARRVMVAFPKAFQAAPKVEHTGNPVREDLFRVAPVAVHSAPLKILVVGGSLGAKALNEVVARLLIEHPELPIQVRHQTGALTFPEISELYKSNKVSNVEPVPFIQDMLSAYTWSDMVICRAGAMTIAELAAVGRASILVPYPYAVDDHQTVNARALTEAGAAFLMPQAEMSVNCMAKMIQSLLSEPERVVQMGLNAKQLAKPNATESVVQGCLEVCCES